MKERVKGKKIKKSKLIKRTISVLMALSLTFNVTPFDVLYISSPSKVFNTELEDSLTVTASAAELTYTPNDDNKSRFVNNTAFANNDTGKKDFLDFCYFYQTDDTFAAQYADATVSVNFITFPSEFMGLGNENVKFRGDFRIQDSGEANVNIPHAIFTHVYDSAKITNANGDPMSLKVVKTSDQSSPLIAEYVYHDESEGAVSASWNVTVASENSNPYAGVIGEMEDGAKLTIAYANHSSAPVSSTSDDTDGVADVGAICGSMKGSSELTVGISAFEETTISSANGNAGGLVGSMEDTSKIIVTSLPSGFAPTVTASGTAEGKGYAGGVVGSMLSSVSVDTNALGTGAFTINGMISGTNGAGGYCGRYVNFAEDATLDLSKYNITATVSGNSSGGVFGVFENQSAKYTIKGGGTGEEDPKIASTCNGGNYGGVIGTYKSVALSEETTALSNSLHLKKMNAFANATGTLTTFGGAIGKVDSAAYIRTDAVKVTATGSDKGWFGGLIGETASANGVFIDLTDFTLSADASGFTGGGVVGKFYNGVLRLSGVTDMTNAKVGGSWTTTAKYGQLVGENDNVLVYALGDGKNGVSAVFGEDDAITNAASGWTFKRSTDSIADDLGTWGEVVRIAGVESDILTPDTTAHTVTLKAAEKTMDSTKDLVLTALNMQLNQGANYDCLLFADNSTSTRDTLLADTLTISGSQSFSRTGVNGFMRDGSDSIGAFTGTLNGDAVTLAIGEKYGYNVTAETTGEGLGQIYRHPYNGLFSIVGSTPESNPPTAEFTSLTLLGNIHVRNAGMSDMGIGGIAARVDGSVNLNGITASQNVKYHEGANINGSETTGKNIGGLIGLVSSNADGSTINVTGTNEISTAFTLSGCHQSWNVLGSLIGKIASPAFTLNIAQGASDSLTDKHTTDILGITAKTDDAYGDGVVGYIIRNGAYSDRKINIDNLTFNGCTVANAANTNGGGLLGFAWLETKTTIGGTNGITVTDATITNSTPANVGAMCYQATGKWTVNKLAINKLTMTDGAGASLGMLVNKAYNEYTVKDVGNKTDALYLDVLNSGYTYTVSAIELPASAVYDELAVYTAQDVLKGRYTSGTTTNGAAVISINMGTRSDGVVSVAATGTYQNKMTAQTKPNPNARYYYNLYKMGKTNAAQDVVLWSVNKYAAENIMGEFDANENPLNKDAATDINFTGISFYPVYTASGDTVRNVNVTFDYSGIYAAETVGSTNTDSYIRDPGAVNVTENNVTTVNRNQHFLMQSGLFIEQGEGSSLTVNNATLAGTFLEVGTYNGAMISDTSHGSVKINGLELRGITPKTTGNAAYTDGYLLVNHIKRENAQKGMITLQVEDVRTATDANYQYATESEEVVTGEGTDAVTTTVIKTKQVTKSLFGEVYGPGLNISFNKMKLDAREPKKHTNLTALDTAYGTRNSIFTASTFLASLKTDALPMPYYNYTYKEDWGENGTGGTRGVTYGKEVSDSVEHRDREHRYYKDEVHFTDPTSATATSSYSFSSGWLPYVKQAYTDNQTLDTNGCYFRELRVNISEVVTSSGCGTYNDPYIINSENQNGNDKNFLASVAAFLRTGNATQLPNVYLPKDYEDYDSLEENTSGERWCENKNAHAEFTYDTDLKTYVYTPTEGDPISWTPDNVRLYLENAYYKVEGAITLPAGFVGLGGNSDNTDTTGKYAFRGVIVGSNNATITNNSPNPLIRVSNGCVVKNITVEQNADVTLEQYTTGSANAAFGYKLPTQESSGSSNTGCSYYGGMIGEIMGGDNIIDNCYVTQASGVNVTVSGSQQLLCPVGSYVGVVVFGGLIFKNMSPTDANRNAKSFKVYRSSDTPTNLTGSPAAIYVNPYVGRVINGYAVNETTQFSVTEDGHYHDEGGSARTAADNSALTQHSLKNTTKHYSIADIDPYYGKTAEQWNALTDAEKKAIMLDVTPPASTTADGTINVPNSQAMFILSLITQSTSGTAQTADGDYHNSLSYGINSSNDTSYVYGMSHNADYTNVGSATVDTDTDYAAASDDTAANTAVPYIIRKYTVHTEDREVTNTWTEIEQRPKYKTVTTVTKSKGNKYTGNGTDLDGVEVYIQVGGNNYLGNSLKLEEGYVNPAADKADGPTIKKVNESQAAIYCFELAENNQYYLYTTDTDGNKRYLYCNNKGFGEWKGDWTTGLGFTENKNDAALFNVEKNGQKYNVYVSTTIKKEDKKQGITGNNNHNPKYDEDCEGQFAFNVIGGGDYGIALFSQKYNTRNDIYLYNVNTTTSEQQVLDGYEDVEVEKSETVLIKGGYPARCVTSTLGYYDINLTGSNYVLPDSFRGIGSVGNYVTAADNTEKYNMKIDKFDGKGRSIDVDIYLNKYAFDNYFNRLHGQTTQDLTITTSAETLSQDATTQHHGIGLFDSAVMIARSEGFSDFTLSGSVNTEIYNNDYTAAEAEQRMTGTDGDANGGDGKYAWLSTGGVCGWTRDGVYANFTKINLNSLSVSGASFIGGLLGFSGLNSNTIYINIQECGAKNFSISMNGAVNNDNRNGIGSFVGKVKQGGVKIYGTSDRENNTDLEKYSTVEIVKFVSYDSVHAVAGGLVGYAGNGCRAYDMHIKAKEGVDVTIGSDNTDMAGGIVGLMQPFKADNTDTVAEYKNCTVEGIDIKAFRFAGGFYGGTWNSATIDNFNGTNDSWTIYAINIDNCKMLGHTGNKIKATKGIAGGFVANGFVIASAGKGSNITIANSRVSNYTIEATGHSNSSAGGFIGYANAKGNNSVVCYIHDSSVENCTLGASGKYAGGAIGEVAQNTENKILGYNIKLDTITDGTQNGSNSNIGAWIGKATNDTSDGSKVTKIQFTGLAIYGNGFTKNVGNGASLNNASFVFADYDGACKNMTDDAEELAQQGTTKVQANKATFNIDDDVTMPKSPYVNVNPQSKMGVREDSTNAVISGDGAVLLDENHKVPAYSIYTSGQTMAAKLYAEIKAGISSRRYTTCADMLKNTEIADGNKFEEYLQRTPTDDGDRISTYKTEHGNLPSGVEDFACIMISTADSAETTNLINQYIRLVTNTTDDYADTNDYYDVDIKTCKLVEDQATGTGEFQLITNPSDPDYTPGIEHDKKNKLFKMTKNKQNADSNKENTFTLFDVQFKDPLDKTKVAYHLYVPVFTTVQLEVNFSAAMKSGTNSVSYLADGITVDRSEYESILDKEEYIHIDNLNTWYTMYFRYSYSKNDLQPLLNAGNLNWNHDKYVTLTKLGNANTNMLPDNTFMTLVNPNSGADKVYYVDALNSTNFPRTTYTDGNNETRVSLTLDFKKFKGVDDQPFKVATLNEMVAQSIEAVPVEGETPDGQYDLYEGGGEPADFTTVSYVYVMDAAGSKTYYQYNPGSGHYNLQFKSGYTGLDEDYYVSVYVPDTDMTKIYGYDISIGDKFPAPRVPNALPKSANVVTEYDSRLVYLGDLYKQTVTFQVKTPDQVITSSNKVLDAYAVTHIEAKSVPVLGILASAKQYTDLFHSYVLTLDRHGENGEIMTRIYGLDKNEDQSSRVTAWYSFDNQIPDDDNPTAALVNNVDVQNNYINVATVKGTDNLMDRIAPNANDITPVTIYSRVRMDFDPTKLETEFPQKTRTDAGVSVRVASNLAYDTSGLAFSSSSKSANDNLGHLYYRTSMDTANLYYKPLTPNLDKYDYDGEYSENYTRVGVNGRRSMSDYMPIDTIANYDYSKVVQAWDEAVNVRLSISLQKKTDTKVDGKVTGVQYANISDITQYWGGIELVADDSGILKPKETLFEHNGNSSFRLTLKDTTSIIINNQEYPVNANTETITVTVPKNTLECDTASYLATIPISFNAKTGTTITQYANYKVNLTVQLLDGSGDPIESCTANDWLVYTNAKINHEFLNNGDD